MKIPCDRRSAAPLRRAWVGGGGFTLVETLLVLALIGLLVAVLLPGVNALMRTINNEEPDRIFLDAVNSARDRALTANRTVLLQFDKEKHRLTWTDASATGQIEVPPKVTIQFLQPKEGSMVLLGGILVETQEIPLVRFYGDGTCDRFRAQIQEAQGTPQILVMDPWTCAPMVTAPK